MSEVVSGVFRTARNKKPASFRERVAACDPDLALGQVACIHTTPESSTSDTTRIRVLRAIRTSDAHAAEVAERAMLLSAMWARLSLIAARQGKQDITRELNRSGFAGGSNS